MPAAERINGEVMLKFLLVHGSWHDGSLWQPVIAALAARGHEARAVTLAGHGKDVDKAVSHEDCVQSVLDFVRAHDLDDIVLVGHSFGGTVIARAAPRLGDRLKRLIFWNAFVPLDGHSLLDEVPPHYRDMFRALAAASDDDTVMLPFDIWREAFIQDADLDFARDAYASLSSEPFAPFDTPLDLAEFYALTVPRSYLNCTEDTALPPGEWGWHPRMSNRLGLHRLVQMPGSHEVMLTNPGLLAEKLVEAGRD